MAKIQSNVILLSFFVLLFLSYSFLVFKSPGKFTSPDETANFYFTKQFAGNLSFRVPEPFNGAAPIVAPRSIVVKKDALVPGSFLGMPFLYGLISWFLGKWIILFLTPLISMIAVFVFYKLISLIFDRRTALISAGLMAIHPAFWYYTARGMFHNALFIDLLIIGFYFIAKVLTKKTTNYKLQTTNYFLIGLFIGGAIAIRTSEIIWIAVLLLAIIIIFRKLIDWRIGIWTALIGMIIPMVPILYQNNKLYGSALTFSYSIGPEKAEVAAKAVGKAIGSGNAIAKIFDNIVGLFEKAIFPFGIHWDNIFANAWNYGIWLVWPFALLTIFGVIAFIKNVRPHLLSSPTSGEEGSLSLAWERVGVRVKSTESIYLVSYLFLSIYLILYYGSWNINDNILGQDLISLEQAYARYWLPIYIFGLPFAAIALQSIFNKRLPVSSIHYAEQRGIIRRTTRKIFGRFSESFFGILRIGVASLVIFLLFNFSVSSVVLEHSVGLAKVRQNTLEYKEVAIKSKRAIESNAVILAGKADKIFFPEFKVIAGEIDTDKKAMQLKKILRKAPVYISILDFAGQSEKLNKLESFGFKIGKEIEVGGEVKLYELVKD